MAPPTSGFLLIADITGYTGFLKESELEHAQETLTALLKLLLSETRPPFVVSRTAGDAVISYAFGEPFLQPQTFVDRLESTYVAFYEHLGDVAIRIQDLAPLQKRSGEVVIRDDEVTLREVLETRVSVEALWDALQDPERRRAMIGSNRIAHLEAT